MQTDKTNRKQRKKKMSYPKLIAIGFLLMIAAGTVLLLLPIATRSGRQTDFLDALFTAASATCVTGLVVVDTYTHWSLFGQLVILGLIQIGGLGFITIGVYIAVAFKRKINLGSREAVNESISNLRSSGTVKLTRVIIRGTLLFELAGAVLLSLRFVPVLGLGEGIYYGVFHSVSAFCNAGFDLMGRYAPFSSLTAWQGDWLVSVTIMVLITIGGIGFIVWEDIYHHKWHFNKYLLHTKVVLTVSFLLSFGGAVLFFLIERGGLLAGMPAGEKALNALFASVTTRAAGFNTVDIMAMSDAGKLLTTVLMFIGGSPGSTAGGIKTTTFAVILVSAFAMIRSTYGTNLFGRRLDEEMIRRASAVLIIDLSLAVTATVFLLATSRLPMADIIMEVFSAISTVGMTTGVTRQWDAVSRIVLILLMYCGRLGSLSFAFVLMQRKTVPPIQCPEGKVIVG